MGRPALRSFAFCLLRNSRSSMATGSSRERANRSTRSSMRCASSEPLLTAWTLPDIDRKAINILPEFARIEDEALLERVDRLTREPRDLPVTNYYVLEEEEKEEKEEIAGQ
ncbi:hypothetical protein AOQ84DRAFT_390944 [Glonium stellatum]|uniref:Uncharacterized protein n=1 Tax=Glonium stellatum TaxID=574774 RepID=A0A8E2EVA8_9PEZI|nr:hypothetical protein AOQ84DRAFT_390944 [Glonium stellatum]